MSSGLTQQILAIDLGTSGPKVALFSLTGELVAHAFHPIQTHLLPGGGAEQKPDEWWSAIKTAVRQLTGSHQALADEIAAVSVTSQWSGTVPVDRGGQPLMDAIIWMDARGAPYVNRITGGFPEISGYNAFKLFSWIRLTGGIPTHSGKDSIAHVLYLKRERPDVYAATHKFLEPKDYINLLLTGQFAASTDSITLHWLTDTRRVNRVEYSPQLLAYCGVERERLPDLKRAVDVLGPLKPEVARELGLKEGIPVVTGTPDVFSAALGSGAVKDYQAHLYLGTSSWLLCHVPFKKTDITNNMASVPSAIPGRYLLLNEQETAGGCLNYLRDNIFFPEDVLLTGERPAEVYRLFDHSAERAPAGSGGLIFTPWLNGERSPIDDTAIRSAFFGQSLHTTREHMIRAVFEGVACNTRWLLGPVERFIGRKVEAINAIGGGANSDIWCQIHADVLNRAVHQVKEPTLANARGAAFLAAVALGCLSFDEIPEKVRFERSFAPNPDNRALYDEEFQEFTRLYRATRGIGRAYRRRASVAGGHAGGAHAS